MIQVEEEVRYHRQVACNLQVFCGRRKLNQDWMTSYITQFLNVRIVAPAGRVPKITSYGENL